MLALCRALVSRGCRQPAPRPGLGCSPLRGGRRRVLALAETGRRVLPPRVEVHNDAVARLVRISQDERVSGGRNWSLARPGLGSW